jgi:hypothetical protein
MRTAIASAIAFLVIGCGGGGPEPSVTTTTPGSDSAATSSAWKVLDLPILADNVRHDTLLIHITYDMGDGLFLMAAQNNNYNKEGIRLYLYRPKADSSAEIIARSKPGNDSETMLPTFFTNGNKADGLVIIANMGERQSWGQEAFWLKDNTIRSLGWLDVAVREWKTVDDSTYQFRTSIAPRTEVRGSNGAFEFSFTGDSLQLYDDLQGHLEVMLPASAVRYRSGEGKATLIVNGQPVFPAAAI